MLISMLKKKKLFIFDMDGTLIESLGVWAEADNLFLKEVAGIDIEASKIGAIRDNFLSNCVRTDPYIAWVEYIKNKYSLEQPLDDLVEYRKKICFDLIRQKLRLKPFAKELLTLLYEHGYKMCLSTSGAPSSLDRIFYEIEATSFLGENIFDLVLNSASVSSLKPSPEIHELALKHFKVDKDEAVIIEDSKVGLEAANNAGIDAIIVKEILNKDYEEVKKEAKYYIDSLEELYEKMLEISQKKPKIRELC